MNEKSKYLIAIGIPVWMHKLPPLIYNRLMQHDLTNKQELINLLQKNPQALLKLDGIGKSINLKIHIFLNLTYIPPKLLRIVKPSHTAIKTIMQLKSYGFTIIDPFGKKL